MPLSNSVIRRYTPPTCTLEVLAQSSPLSRWMGKSVLKQVRFNLRFDDPRQPEEQKIVVQGDRDQLEALHTIISGYVQEILQQSPENFWASRVGTFSGGTTSEASVVKDSSNLGRDTYSSSSSSGNRFSPGDNNIHIQPSSNLTHELFLGSLANQTTSSSIQLGLLQLFDLATALDEYMTDVVVLPNTTQQAGASSFAIPGWAPVAAVLVLGLGLVPFTYQYANRVREQNKTGETIATAKQKVGNNAADQPSLTPLPTPNSALTPSPKVSSPLPTLGTSLNPLNPSLSNPASPTPNLSATQKPGTTFPSASTNPPSSLSSLPLPPSLGRTSLGGSATTKPVNGGQSLPSSPNTTLARNNNRDLITKPNLGGNNPVSLPTSKTNLPSASLPSLKNPSTPKTPVISSKPATANSKTQGNLRENPSNTNNDLAAILKESRTAANPRTNTDKSNTTTAAANSQTLFDKNNNQVAEVRSYLKQRWRPPSGLSQPLQYSLTVGVDGALEQILPLGKAARDYVDRANIPEIGQPFISPSRNGQNVKVRAVLRPNGKVEVFSETD